MLAQAGRAAVDRGRRGGELDRRAGQHDGRVLPRLLDLDQHAARLRVRVFEDVARRVHRPDGHLAPEGRHDLAPGVAPGPRRDQAADLGRGGHALVVVVVARVGGELGPADRLAEQLPVVVGRGGDRDRAVGGREDVEGAERGMAGAPRPEHPPRVGEVVDDALAQAHERVVHRDVEELPGAGQARGMDRRDDPERAERPGEEVADARAAGDAARARRPGRSDDAAHALRDDVERRPLGVGTRAGPGIAEAADRRVDEPRVPHAQPLVADAETVHHADAGVLHHGVGPVDEAEEDVPVGGRAQVEHHRALVPIDAREVASVVAALAIGGKGRQRAAHVALRRLDLHHVGAEVGEQHRAEGPREGLRQVEDAEVGERSGARGGHRSPPSGAWRPQWLRRLSRTSRSPSKTIVPSCFTPQWRKRTMPASSRSAARLAITSV